MSHFYKVTGYAAGAAIVVIAVVILAQIVLRMFDINFAGGVEIATYAMIVATFVALPYTLMTGGHIRVMVGIESLPRPAQRLAQVACYLVALAFVAIFFYYFLEMTRDSFARGARSQGLLAAPIWVPQSIVTAGILLFGVALVHGLIGILRGRPIVPETSVENL
ncbi:MAG: TRAP transporter small permease [Betaproteobacteria bacterium]|nr:MAG: TRAP transporter small permease [Betaproteobacteria bacterium]